LTHSERTSSYKRCLSALSSACITLNFDHSRAVYHWFIQARRMDLVVLLALGSVLVLMQRFIWVSPNYFLTTIRKRLPMLLPQPLHFSDITTWLHRPGSRNTKEEKINEIDALAEHHEVAEKLNDLIKKDGAGSWPPNANHDHATWPAALRPYKEIYLELASLLPQATPSLDDSVNITRIADFRKRFCDLLKERVKMDEVMEVSGPVTGRTYERTSDTFISFCKQPIPVAGAPSRAVLITRSIAASRQAGTRIDGPPSPLFRSLSWRRKSTYPSSSLSRGLRCRGTSTAHLKAGITVRHSITSRTLEASIAD
jgi:hypothetical protein